MSRDERPFTTSSSTACPSSTITRSRNVSAWPDNASPVASRPDVPRRPPTVVPTRRIVPIEAIDDDSVWEDEYASHDRQVAEDLARAVKIEDRNRRMREMQDMEARVQQRLSAAIAEEEHLRYRMPVEAPSSGPDHSEDSRISHHCDVNSHEPAVVKSFRSMLDDFSAMRNEGAEVDEDDLCETPQLWMSNLMATMVHRSAVAT